MLEQAHAAFTAALALHQRGDLAAAEAAYRALLERWGAHADAEHMLALVLHQGGRSHEALAWFGRAARQPTPLLHSNHASALLALGQGAAAETQGRHALALDATRGGAWLNLGLALEIQRRHAEAADALREALARLPAPAAAARRALARCLIADGRGAEAESWLQPLGDDAEARLLRAEARLAAGDLAGAATQLADRGELAPELEAQRCFLAAELARARHDSDRALALLGEALRHVPEHRQATLRRALLRLHRGDTEPALAQLQAWLARHPDDADARSAWLSACQYSPHRDAAALLAAHRDWAARHVPEAPTFDAAAIDRDPQRRLRVGWLSPRFRHSPVHTFFLEPLRRLRQRDDFEHVLYHDGRFDAAESAPFRDLAPAWRDVAALDDAQLRELIRADGIDLLVDLAGHGPQHRLRLFGMRAAPVQVSWLEYYCSTGLARMDFLLGDAWLTPPGSEAHYSERVLRLPYGRLCYAPPMHAAPRAGVEQRRLISLNRFSKLNDEVVALWSRVLRALPGWTLLLKGEGGDDEGVVAALRGRFAAHGVAPEQLEFAGYGSVGNALAAYADAAIALDPFPFSGCITSYDALWCGLPLVTWPRDTFASRQSAALLQALGRGDWIAASADDYVRIVSALASDAPARAAWAREAPARVREALCDADIFTGQLATALRAAWRQRAAAGFPDTAAN